jgi:hypothetical protein
MNPARALSLSATSSLLLLTAAIGSCAAQAQQPQPQCGDLQQIARHLAARFGEQPTARAVGAGGALFHVFASPASGSWTILRTEGHGPSCIVASGDGWEAVGDPGEPA